MIKAFGTDWQEEILEMRKSSQCFRRSVSCLILCYVVRSDTSSLTDTAQGAQPMNLHSRVIQSGLDSITGPDANSIVLLFTGCALFAEVILYKSYVKTIRI